MNICKEIIRLKRLIQKNLTDDLRRAKYRGHPNKLHGHCYVASEALYHLLKKRGISSHPCCLRVDGDIHWYLVVGETYVDPTSGQFIKLPDWSKGKRKGFLTKHPSKRATILIDKVEKEIR